MDKKTKFDSDELLGISWLNSAFLLEKKYFDNQSRLEELYAAYVKPYESKEINYLCIIKVHHEFGKDTDIRILSIQDLETDESTIFPTSITNREIELDLDEASGLLQMGLNFNNLLAIRLAMDILKFIIDKKLLPQAKPILRSK